MKAWDNLHTMWANSSLFPASSHLTLVQRTVDTDLELFPDGQNILNDHNPQNASYFDSVLSYITTYFRYICPRLWDNSFYTIFFFPARLENSLEILTMCIWRSKSKQNQLLYIQGNLSLLMATCIWGTHCIYLAGTFPAFCPDSQFRHLKRLVRCFSTHTTATQGSVFRKRKVHDVRQKDKEFRLLQIRRFWVQCVQLIVCLPISCKIRSWCDKL